MARAQNSVRRISKSDVLNLAQQAREFHDAAEDCFKAGSYNPAASNSVTAVINCADAVSGAKQGTRWAGAHEQTAKHVAKAGTEGEIVARDLEKIMPFKNKAQYDAHPVSRSDAEMTLRCAARCVQTVEALVSKVYK